MVHRHRLPWMLPLLATLAFAGAATAGEGAAELSAPAAFPNLVFATAEPLDLKFEEGAPIRDVYVAVGKALGLNVLFDPKLRDREIRLQLEDVAADKVLDTLANVWGHFYKVIDERTVMIADDTPQNRRTYEDQVIQTFYLEHAELRDAMTMIRSLIGAKHVAAHETLNALVIRDSAVKVRIAEQILRGHDKPRSIVAVDVALLEVDAGRLGVLGSADDAGSLPLTLDAGAMKRLQGAAGVRTVTRASLSARDGKEADLAVKHRVRLPARSAGRAARAVQQAEHHEVGLELSVEPVVHTGHDELTLKVRLQVDYLDDLAPAGDSAEPVPTKRELTSEVRVTAGETVFLSGLWSLDGCPSATSDRVLALLAPRACDAEEAVARHLLVALTPRIVERASITDRDRAPIGIGTEARLADPRPMKASID